MEISPYRDVLLSKPNLYLAVRFEHSTFGMPISQLECWITVEHLPQLLNLGLDHGLDVHSLSLNA